LAAAYDLKEDQDGALQMVNWTPIMGATSRSCGAGEYLGAVQRISIGNNLANPEPAPTPYFIVDHPIKLGTLLAKLIPLTDVPTGSSVYVATSAASGGTAGPGRQPSDEFLKRGIGALGTFWSATVKQSANIIGTATDISGGAFSQEGLIYVSELEPRADPDTSDKSLRGAVELNYWGSYVWGTYRPTAYGCEILGIANLPTA
jgi:hypothetical protein